MYELYYIYCDNLDWKE